METQERDLNSFARSVEALDPYLSSLVFIGGWAQYLYALRPEAVRLPFDPLHTRDLDVVISPALPKNEDSIAELLQNAGFQRN